MLQDCLLVVVGVLRMQMFNCLYNHSCESMHEIPDNSVHLVITSPPYNVGKDYTNSNDDLPLHQYRLLLQTVWTECYRVLVNGGRACINVTSVGYNPRIPIPSYTTIDMLDTGFNMRGEVVWDQHGQRVPFCPRGNYLSPKNLIIQEAHEHILIFSKGDFKREGEEKTMTDAEYKVYSKGIWRIKHESSTKIGHPAPFPIEIPYRLIKMFSFTNEVVLDPFMGSGTTAVASKSLNRRYIGYDTSLEYIEMSNERLRQEYLW